jgi:predicted dehydrogenase
MLRVGIVGCGKIADAHASQIVRMPNVEIVGVCDQEPLMSRQLKERFPVRGSFSDLTRFLDEGQPDVVHITTPPASHYEIARRCIERGCHVYIEKPFTVTAEEADRLLEYAKQGGVKVTVGHNYQFTNAALKMRRLVKDGFVGDRIVHMESYFGYDLSDPSYARALLGDKQHWVRRLPGALLQNTISHGIARISEFLTGSGLRVITTGTTSPMLRSLGETQMCDELRVIITEDNRLSAYFTFSSQMKPILQEFRIYGDRNGILLDQSHEVVLKLRGAKFKSYADFFIPPVQFSMQYMSNLLRNQKLFLRRDLHMDIGIRNLIAMFYRSIVEGGPVPIPYEEIRLTARIMDEIFSQLNSISNCEGPGLEASILPGTSA